MKKLLNVISFLLFVFTVGGTHSMAQENILSPGHWRGEESLGAGFGPVFGLGQGLQLYVDYNISSNLQIHSRLMSETLDRTNIFGGVILSTQRSMTTGSLRFFPSEQSGWFVGGGSGFATVTQTYTFGEGADSEASFIPIFFDGGWQGWDGYYFTVSLDLGTSIVLSETDATGNLPTEFAHRTMGESDFESAKSPGGLMLGFGWYIQ